MKMMKPKVAALKSGRYANNAVFMPYKGQLLLKTRESSKILVNVNANWLNGGFNIS